MNETQNKPKGMVNLRHQAEATLIERKKNAAAIHTTEGDTRRLVHELEVHQIELEMQNEELVQSHAQVEAWLSRYTDLYEFAPMGYFTLACDGTIQQVNLAGTNMLGEERSRLLKRNFGAFVSTPSSATFNTFLEKVFKSRRKETCEVLLKKDGVFSLWVHIEATCPEDAQECRAVVADITMVKEAEARRDAALEEIRKLNNELENKVKERTAELKATIAQLEEVNKTFIGRELRMIELKKRITELEETEDVKRTS